MMILGALPEGWDHLASTLLHSVDSEDLTLSDVVPKLQDEWDRRSIRHGGGDSHAFVARNTIKRPGRKPQWQAQQQQPQYRQPSQQQNSGQYQNRPQGPQHFQGRPLRDRIAPYNPNQQCFQPRQQQGFNPNIAPGARGPNYNKNAQNRSNKKLKKAMLAGQSGHMEGSSGMCQDEKANLPRFANMAIRDDEVSIKQESMEIDLSPEAFLPLTK